MNNNYEQQSDFIIAKYTEELSQREGVRSFMKNNVKEKIASQASTLNFNHLTFLESLEISRALASTKMVFKYHTQSQKGNIIANAIVIATCHKILIKRFQSQLSKLLLPTFFPSLFFCQNYSLVFIASQELRFR